MRLGGGALQARGLRRRAREILAPRRDILARGLQTRGPLAVGNDGVGDRVGGADERAGGVETFAPRRRVAVERILEAIQSDVAQLARGDPVGARLARLDLAPGERGFAGAERPAGLAKLFLGGAPGFGEIAVAPEMARDRLGIWQGEPRQRVEAAGAGIKPRRLFLERARIRFEAGAFATQPVGVGEAALERVELALEGLGIGRRGPATLARRLCSASASSRRASASPCRRSASLRCSISALARAISGSLGGAASSAA